MSKMAVLVTAFILGGCVCMLGLFIEYNNELVHGAEYSDYEWQWMSVPSGIAALPLRFSRESDVRLTETWLFHRWAISIAGGVMAVIGVLLVWCIRIAVNSE